MAPIITAAGAAATFVAATVREVMGSTPAAVQNAYRRRSGSDGLARWIKARHVRIDFFRGASLAVTGGICLQDELG
jgi:hypothetical protein